MIAEVFVSDIPLPQANQLARTYLFQGRDYRCEEWSGQGECLRGYVEAQTFRRDQVLRLEIVNGVGRFTYRRLVPSTRCFGLTRDVLAMLRGLHLTPYVVLRPWRPTSGWSVLSHCDLLALLYRAHQSDVTNGWIDQFVRTLGIRYLPAGQQKACKRALRHSLLLDSGR